MRFRLWRENLLFERSIANATLYRSENNVVELYFQKKGHSERHQTQLLDSALSMPAWITLVALVMLFIVKRMVVLFPDPAFLAK